MKKQNGQVWGIDPDSNKSGVAKAVDGNLVSLECMRFVDLIEMFAMLPPGTKIYIEDVTVDKGTYGRKKVSVNAMKKISQDVGRVKQTYYLIVQFALHYNLHIIPVKPLAKQSPEIFGVAKKKDYAFNRLCKWEGRTNEEKRDAGMLALFGPDLS